MTFITFLLVILIVAAITVISVIVYVLEKNKKNQPMSTKHVTNYIHKFNKGHRYGRLIKKVPVGRDRNILKILYSAIDIDEFQKKEVVYETILAHKDHIIETNDEIKILPRDITEIDPADPQYDFLSKYIQRNKDFNSIAEATHNSQRKLSKAFTEHYAGQVYQEIVNSYKEALVNQRQEEPKEDDTK